MSAILIKKYGPDVKSKNGGLRVYRGLRMVEANSIDRGNGEVAVSSKGSNNE